jgi:hypothetical protein
MRRVAESPGLFRSNKGSAPAGYQTTCVLSNAISRMRANGRHVARFARLRRNQDFRIILLSTRFTRGLQNLVIQPCADIESGGHHSVEVRPDGMNQSVVMCSQQEPRRPNHAHPETGCHSPPSEIIQDNEIGRKTERQRNRLALSCTQG